MKKNYIFISLFLLGIILIGFLLFNLLNSDENTIKQILNKEDPISGERTKSLIGSANIEGIERAGITSDEINYLIDRGIIDLEGIHESIKKIILEGENSQNFESSSENNYLEEAINKSSTEELILGEKLEILNSGNSDEKIDLLFIPKGISDISILKSKINNLFYNPEGSSEGKGLFKTPPFDDYTNKFNIAYINQNIDEAYFDFSFTEIPEGSTPKYLHFYFNTQKIKEEYDVFNPDYIIILFDSDYTSGGAEIQQLNLGASNYAWTFVHEFGHQFGGLADEYVLTNSPAYRCGDYIEESVKNISGVMINIPNCFKRYHSTIPYYPNLDLLGCPKWCEDYNKTKLIEENEICTIYSNEEDCSSFREGVCTWFETKHPDLNTHCVRTQGDEDIGINCIENTKCVFGGDYGQLAFNTGGNSIMNGGTEFTYPSKNHLENILECCYPSKDTLECNEFKSRYADIPGDIGINYYFKIAYEKIANCD